jgi:uncharacterized protein YifE (UPF0438 family)
MPETEPSCQLTPEEEVLLQRHIRFYRDLETGQRKPATEAQRRFVEVTLGHAAAESMHERAYVKHMRLRTARHESTRNEHIHNPEDGPTEEWFSRDDWRKLRRRQLGDMRRD